MMNHRQPQHPRGVAAQTAPVHNHEQKPFNNKSRKQRDNAKVPHLALIQASNARRSLSQKEPKHHTKRRERAIRLDEHGSDVEENWMHLSQNIPSGFKEGRIRPTGP
jgi:hypothetical protein